MESERYDKLVNIIEEKQTHRYRQQTSDYLYGTQRGAIYGWGSRKYELLGVR